MKLRKIIRYLEIIDRELEILYINFSKRFKDYPRISLFWKEMSLEKEDLYSCLSLIEQVGEENLVIEEYKEEEFICVMEKLTRYIKNSLEKSMKLEEASEVAVEIETEHYAQIFNHLGNLVEDAEFKQVISDLDHNKEYRNRLRSFIVEHYPENDKKSGLIKRIEKSFK